MTNRLAASFISADSVRKVAFRFQVGEIVFYTWMPQLALVYYCASEANKYAGIRGNLYGNLPPNADGVIIRGLPAHAHPEGIRTYGEAIEYVPRHNTSYLVKIEGQFEAYLATHLSTKPRQNIKRAVRKIKALNGSAPSLEIFTKPSEMPQFLMQAAAISHQTFQAKLFSLGLLDTPERQRHLHQTAMDGNARGYLLKLDGKAIAFAWCRRKNDRLIYDIIGYLPDQAEYSPGMALLYLILEDLFNIQAYTALDFGSGYAQYKSMFATSEELSADAFIFRLKYKNRALTMLHQRLLNFSVFISKSLDYLGIKGVLKNIFRALVMHKQ